MKNCIKIVAVIAVLICVTNNAFAAFGVKAEAPEKAKGTQASPPAAPQSNTPASTGDIVVKYNDLLKDYASLRADRDNLQMQAKNLLAERNKLLDVKDSMGQFEDDKKRLISEKAELDKKVAELGKKVAWLEGESQGITKERDQLKAAYKKAVRGSDLEELKSANQEMAAIKKENQDTAIKMKTLQVKAEDLTRREDRAIKRAIELSASVSSLKKDVAEAERKNKALERELNNIPKKFTEMARQNTGLIKETGEMHYNLGVFYTKEKEYSRAIAEFEKVIDINPNDAYAHFNLGYIYAEYQVNRKKAIEQFRQYLRLAKGDDKDIDWVRKYLLTWETYEGKQVMD